MLLDSLFDLGSVLDALIGPAEKPADPKATLAEKAAERFRMFFELSGMGGEIVDAQTYRFLQVNSRLCDLLGYSASELKSKTFFEVTYVEDREREMKGYERVKAGLRDHWQIEKRYVRKDGGLVSAIVHGTMVRDKDGRPTQSLASIQDVTDLRQNEQAFRETFNLAPIGIAHVSHDGQWLKINRAMCEITGYNEEELKLMTFGDITHPDDLEKDWSHAKRLWAGEISQYRVEKRYIRKDKSIIWGDLTVSLKRSVNGTPEYFISCVEDITEKIRDKETLRASDARYRLLVETVPQLMWTMDPKGLPTYFSHQWLGFAGKTPTWLIRHWTKIVHPDDLARHIRTRKTAFLAGEAYVSEIRLLNAEGEYLWYMSRVVPLKDHRGVILGWYGSAVDIEDRKRAELARGAAGN